MDMSHRNLNIILFIYLIILFGCEPKKNNSIENTSERKLAKINLIAFSKKVHKGQYEVLLKTTKDSLNIWAKNKCINFGSLSIQDWQLDSVFALNNEKNKIITAILIKGSFFPSTIGDGLIYLYGVKINKKWYFFAGPFIALPRAGYGYPKNKPMPFDKLHKIALEEIFSSYLIENEKSGELKINEAFFADLTSNAWYDKNKFIPKTQEDWNKIYLKIVAENWKHKDTTNYERLREEEMKKNK
jgi:hypothetical protein